MQIAAAGDRAVLLTGVPPLAMTAPGVLAAIPGHDSLLVICDAPPDVDALARAIAQAGTQARATRTHAIAVHFDGADLPELLAHASLSHEEFLARVRDVRLRVRYLGFRAGFAYCEGWPAEWRLRRRPTSRNRVPRGTFAVAGEMAGFYPVDSPGGWNLLGTTNASLWDPSREPPNLLMPGDEVTVVPLAAAPQPFGPTTPSERGQGEIIGEVLSPGQFTLIAGPADYGRVAAGVPPGGPFDPRAAARANAMLGNREDAPLLECVMVGPTLRLTRRAAFCAGDEVRLFAAGEMAIGRFHGALRGYLAIEGGFDEMRARYDEAPHVLQRGEVLRGGNARGTASAPERGSERLVIRIANGPHDAPPLPVEWEVTNQLNRVGIRLRPLTPLAFTPPADLASCGMQFGTLQWHPDGSLIAMGPDHPVTGGYLQPATVLWDERWKLGQLAPGERVKLVAV